MSTATTEKEVYPERIYPIKVDFQGTEIHYNEPANRWEFTLRNRERFTDSLEKAREIISKPFTPSKKKKPFTRFTAWTRGRYGRDGFVEVEVTSLAARGQYNHHDEVWVNSPERGREKIYVSSILPQTDRNRSLKETIETLEGEVRERKGRITELEKSMDRSMIVRPEEQDEN